MPRWHLSADWLERLKADVANSWPRSNKRLTIALAVGGLVLLFTCNPFVKKPSVPVVTGPDVGAVGIPLEFKATSTDPNGDSVAFMYDWGDAATKVWTDFVLSDETLSVSHTYAESSSYAVKARARNGKGTESGWSSGHPIQLGGIGPGYPDSLAAEVRIPGYGTLNSLVCSKDGSKLFAAVAQDVYLLVLRMSDYQLIDTIIIGPDPVDIVLSPDGGLLYAAVAASDSIKVVRTSDDSVVRSIAIGNDPRALAITSSGDYLYVALASEDSVAKLRLSDGVVVKKLPTSINPAALAIDGMNNCLYAATFYGGIVTKYSLSDDALAGQLFLGQGLSSIAVRPGGDRVYVGDCQGRLFDIASDLSEVRDTLPYFGCIGDIVFTPDSFYMLIPSSEHHGVALTRVDQDANVGWLTTEGLIRGVAVSPDGQRILAGDDARMRICIFMRRQ